MQKKKLFRLGCILTPILIIFLNFYINFNKIPSIIFVKENALYNTDKIIKVGNLYTSSINRNNNSNRIDLKFLGLFPVKSVSVRAVPDMEVYPGGTSIGVKLSTKGVLVVAFSDVEARDGKLPSPAAQNGINIGDSILKVNNVNIESAEQLVKLINESEGKEIDLVISRKGQIINKKITPVKHSNESKYKIGLWVRDSTAGVGTLTFYDAKSKIFGALGHPITDVDTGTLLSVSKGNIVKSSIVNIRKGEKGNPGELKGIFIEENRNIGSISNNTECGIFGESKENLANSIYSKPIKIALRNEIKEGPAKIITTIDEDGPKLYNIEIQKLLQQESPGPKSMLIKITDPVLLEKTGGIVQGMSGSPIIQNGKLVGAVTHVLINKPDTGYGIYIEWMIKDSNILPK